MILKFGRIVRAAIFLFIALIAADEAVAATFTARKALGFNGGVKIFLDGPIVEGDQKRFSSLVSSLLNHGFIVEEVILNSPGGLVSEGTAIGKRIRALKANTRAPWIAGGAPSCERPASLQPVNPTATCTCDSACYLIWAGGIFREGNYVGVHRFRFDPKYYGGLSFSDAKEKYEHELVAHRQYLEEMNVPREVIDANFQTGSDAIRYLTWEQMKASRVTQNYLEELLIARCGRLLKEPNVKYWECKEASLFDLRVEAIREYLSLYNERLSGFSPKVQPSDSSKSFLDKGVILTEDYFLAPADAGAFSLKAGDIIQVANDNASSPISDVSEFRRWWERQYDDACKEAKSWQDYRTQAVARRSRNEIASLKLQIRGLHPKLCDLYDPIKD